MGYLSARISTKREWKHSRQQSCWEITHMLLTWTLWSLVYMWITLKTRAQELLPKFIVLPKFSFWYDSIVFVNVTEFSSPQEGGPTADSNVKETNTRLLSLIFLAPFSLLLSAWIFCLVFRKVYFKTCLGNYKDGDNSSSSNNNNKTAKGSWLGRKHRWRNKQQWVAGRGIKEREAEGTQFQIRDQTIYITKGTILIRFFRV